MTIERVLKVILSSNEIYPFRDFCEKRDIPFEFGEQCLLVDEKHEGALKHFQGELPKLALVPILVAELSLSITDSEMLETTDLIKKGKKLEAIKNLKFAYEKKGRLLSLKDSKEYVDKLATFLNLKHNNKV